MKSKNRARIKVRSNPKNRHRWRPYQALPKITPRTTSAEYPDLIPLSSSVSL